MMSTICALMLAAVGLMMVHRTCKPYNLLRRVLIVGLTVSLIFSVFFLGNLFTLTALDTPAIMIMVVFGLLAWPGLKMAYVVEDAVREKLRAMRSSGRHLKRAPAK